MRLVGVDISGYRRFRSMSEMNLEPRLICIVGPNAAGKSSFLDALQHVHLDEPFKPRERTRGISEEPQIQARYVLEREDRDEVASIPEARAVTQLIVSKSHAPRREMQLSPAPIRDLAPRHSLLQRLQLLKSHRWTDQLVKREEDGDDDRLLSSVIAEVQQVTDSEAQTLDRSARAILRALADTLDEEGSLPYRFRGLPRGLRTLADHEDRPHPHAAAVQVLQDRVPAIVKFEDEARELKATYDLNDPPDLAITNLLALGGTSWEELGQIVDRGDKGRKQVWMDRTNKHLRSRVSKAWGQTPLELRLDVDGRILTILMKMQRDDFIEIDQHSDGLRQFVALRALIAVRGAPIKPIVLIDEAETHLHYDAQADLISVLESQDDAAKVIYTTHSAGCLPHDLGTGIRAIVPRYTNSDWGRVQTDDSEIVTRLWTHGEGFFPLLLAMGASAFAFSAVQTAAITEGISDAILLPSMIREAIGRDRLPYKLVPGYAEASKDEVLQLDLMAARVAFVADGDSGGRAHAQKLLRTGVLSTQIVLLGGKGSGLSPEDLLDKRAYTRAVNALLSRKRPGTVIDPDDVPDIGRSKAVARWAGKQPKIDGKRLKLRKAAIAHAVLEERSRGSIVARKHRPILRDLDRELQAVFRKGASELKRTGSPAA